MDRIWTERYDRGVPSTLSYPEIVLPDLLTDAAARWPNRPALRFYGGTIRYHELDDLVNRFAEALIRARVEPGGVVGLMLPNLPQTVIGYYGSLRAGTVVTPINPLYVEHEIEYQVTDSGCETILALEQFYPRIKPLLGRTCLKRVILTSVKDYLPWLKRLLYPIRAGREGRPEGSPTPSPEVSSLRRFMDVPASRPAVTVRPQDMALLQYTGGTTGTPKGVMLTHRNLVCNTWQCRHWMTDLRQGQEVFLGVLPFFHVYGISACQNLAVGVAGTLVLLPRFQVTEVLGTISRERITVFPGIPAMYAAISGQQHVTRYDLRSIRLCISGAGPLPPSVQDRFESLTGARLVEGYGLTEAGPVTHVNPLRPAPGERRRGSIGLPLPDTDAKVVDVETGQREVASGEVGELVVRGPQVMRGYWRRDAETQQVLKDEWLFTGDLARMDPAGFFSIEGRKKEMIKAGGENVYPREVEEVLLRHPQVEDAVVVGIPQDLRGELIKAYVVLKPGAAPTAAEILAHCRKDLAKFKVPKQIEFRPSLPKTLVGKVLRRLLVEEEVQKRRASQSHAKDDAGR
jgi:long-chain acyl-CoA synthetase